MSPGAWGRSTPGHRAVPQHGLYVDRRRGHAAGGERGHAASEREGPARAADPDRAFQGSPERPRHAQSRLQTGGDVYRAAGALKVYERGPFSSTHNMGTCRQSAKPADGVCNKFGQTHDIPNLFISDGSQFTTGAAENPTLTIVALAIRQAEYLSGSAASRRGVKRRPQPSIIVPSQARAKARASLRVRKHPALCARSASGADGGFALFGGLEVAAGARARWFS